MTKLPRKTSRRRPTASAKLKPFVVFVRYPGSMKEYEYLCDFPAKQGDVVLGNSDCKVTIIRTAEAEGSAAFKYVRPNVPSTTERRFAIVKRLNELATLQRQMDLFAGLSKKNPEAKALLAELKRLK